MKKYLEPSMNIKKLSLEDVVTSSGINTLIDGGSNGEIGTVSGGDGVILDQNALYFE